MSSTPCTPFIDTPTVLQLRHQCCLRLSFSARSDPPYVYQRGACGLQYSVFRSYIVFLCCLCVEPAARYSVIQHCTVLDFILATQRIALVQTSRGWLLSGMYYYMSIGCQIRRKRSPLLEHDITTLCDSKLC